MCVCSALILRLLIVYCLAVSVQPEAFAAFIQRSGFNAALSLRCAQLSLRSAFAALIRIRNCGAAFTAQRSVFSAALSFRSAHSVQLLQRRVYSAAFTAQRLQRSVYSAVFTAQRFQCCA